MLRFFRNIRQKLIEQEKMKKYIWYALGEILLVMIGILLALQVNNWNQERNNIIEIERFMVSIAENMKQDQVNLKSLIAERDSAQSGAFRVLQNYYSDVHDYELIMDVAGNVFFDRYMNFNESGFEAFKNSPHLGNIEVSKYQEALYDYYNVVSEIKAQEKSYNEFIEQMESDSYATDAIEQVFKFGFILDPAQHQEELSNAVKSMLENTYVRGAFVRTATQRITQSLYEDAIEKADVFIELSKSLEEN